MNIYILSDDINNSITIPVHFIVDEKGVLINSDIVLTLFDITDKLVIYIENKSRGSDYGD